MENFSLNSVSKISNDTCTFKYFFFSLKILVHSFIYYQMDIYLNNLQKNHEIVASQYLKQLFKLKINFSVEAKLSFFLQRLVNIFNFNTLYFLTLSKIVLLLDSVLFLFYNKVFIFGQIFM